jgi:hypothetical protein
MARATLYNEVHREQQNLCNTANRVQYPCGNLGDTALYQNGNRLGFRLCHHLHPGSLIRQSLGQEAGEFGDRGDLW